MTSSSVGIWKRPLKRCGRSGKVCTARSDLISASVKSEAKKPVVGTPSTIFVVSRPGNLARTSVVLVMSGSCRAIR